MGATGRPGIPGEPGVPAITPDFEDGVRGGSESWRARHDVRNMRLPQRLLRMSTLSTSDSSTPDTNLTGGAGGAAAATVTTATLTPYFTASVNTSSAVSPAVSAANSRNISPALDPRVLDSLVDEELAYTRQWGYVLIVASWTCFVIGFGAIAGVWRWAFRGFEWLPPSPPTQDVLGGIFHRADKDFVMDGYYPCLAILSLTIVAWSWALINWLGLKYFRHSPGTTY